MKYMIGLLAFLAVVLLPGCSDGPRQPKAPDKRQEMAQAYQMACSYPVAHPNNNVRRCENSEVLCYVYGGEGIQCKFKTQ